MKRVLQLLGVLFAIGAAQVASAQFDCTIGLNLPNGGLDGNNPIIVLPNAQATLYNLCTPFPGGQAVYTWTGPNIQGPTNQQLITVSTPSGGSASYTAKVTAAGQSGTASTALQVLSANAPVCTITQSPAGQIPTGQTYTLTASCSKPVTQYFWTGTSTNAAVVSITAPATAGNVVHFLTPIGAGSARGPTASITVAVTAVRNYEGLWWNAPGGSESGWGINFAHQGDTIFATWFTFGPDGKPTWLVVAANRVSNRVYSGKLYTGTGPAFDSVPFDPTKVVANEVGSASFNFAADDVNATFDYVIGPVAQTKNITRQVFASPVPTCVWGGGDPALATNYQDIWWAAPGGSESGWGVNFNHQGDTIFATWFTFGHDGKPVWYVVAANKTAANTYAGKLFTGTGPPYNAVPFDSSLVVPAEVGNATLTFANGNSATFAYTVGDVTQSKQVTRQVFAAPATVCH